LLADVCRTGGFSGLYFESIRAVGIDLGFASPGADEAILITDLIAALRAAVLADNVSALVAFHVGITRVEGDYLRGPAVIRTCELLRALPAAAPRCPLVVGISAGLFDEIGPECGFTDGWVTLAAARARFHIY
jgi:hypothetical protein